MSVWHQLWNEPDAAVIKRGLGEATDAEKLASDASETRHAAREGLHRGDFRFL